jgi:hypothetical protein
VPSIVGDLAETLRPVIAAPGEDLDGVIGEMDLDPKTVELDLVYPSFAAR